MAIYLGHTTARRILESRLVLDLDHSPYRGPLNCQSGKRDVKDVLSAAFKDFAFVDLPSILYTRPGEGLDLLVSNPREKRRWKGAKCHVIRSKLPSRSFWLVEEGIFVASPELCLLQLAESLSLIDTIKAAMSFCGIYRLVGDTTSKSIFDRKPIMTVDSGLAFLDSVGLVPGAVNMRRALQYTLPNSGSPMETRMVLPFYLPKALGGFGLPRPVMNKPIYLDESAREIAGVPQWQELFAGDAAWTNKATKRETVFEYQSKENHDNEASYGSDYARQLALESMGHRVHFVTNTQLNSLSQMEELARCIVRETGIKYDLDAPMTTERRRKLLDEVNS